MPGWLSRNNFSPSDFVHASDLNNLANDNITWGGDVNGGGYHLSNVILQGSGGFSAYVSPMEVTPGSAGTTCLQLDQTVGANHVARWTVCKDATAETGSNTGSNFAIGRYTDAGVVIDAPIAINRSTGLITMGAQQWAGAVNGGGQTLSNVVIPGTLADPTTTKGDLLARSASAVSRVALGADGFILTADSSQALGVKWAAAPATGVPTSRNINTGVGLSGGGPLTADLNLAGVVFGASGASHKSGDVPDPGAAAQATRYLREDATWAIPSGTGGGMTDPTTTKGDLIVHGSGITRLAVGTDGQVLMADSTQATGIKWGAAATGGSQTPWTSNINANNFSLLSAASIGLKIAVPLRELHVASVAAGGGVAISGAAPGLMITNADTEPNTNTSSIGIGLATASNQFGLPNAGDSIIFTVGSARGDIYINSNYSGGGVNRNILLQPNGGNVGIGTGTGTTAPAAKFTVYGPGSTGAGICDVQITSPGTIGAGINIVSTDTGGKNWALISCGSGNSPGAFGLFDATAGSYGLWISSAHNVGINNTVPAAPLDVVGNVIIRGQCNIYGGAKATSGVCVYGITSTDATQQLQGFLQLFFDPTAVNRRLSLGLVEQGIAWRNITLCESGGSVGIGVAVPRSALSIITANPSTPATATQFTIGESTNNAAYQLSLGYYYSGSSYQGVIQTTAGTPSALLLNPSGGNVGIGTAAPAAPLNVHGPQTQNQVQQQWDVYVGVNVQLRTGSDAWPDFGTSTPHGLWFMTGGVRCALFDASGNLGIGRAPGYKLDVVGDVNCTGTFRLNGTAISVGGISGVGWQQGGIAISTRPNCNFTAGGTIGYSVTDVPGSNRVDVFYSVGSDVRLKRNLIPLTGGLDLINRLRPYEFEYNGLGGREGGRRAVSVLAQDLQSIYPQGVTTYPAKLRPEDAETTDLLTFDPLDILCHAALAIQQLSARIETLEKLLKGN